MLPTGTRQSSTGHTSSFCLGLVGRITGPTPAHNLVSGVSAITYTGVQHSTPGAPERVAARLLSLMQEHWFGFPLCVVCVGTDRSTGDSLGPLVGSYLEGSGFGGSVFGTLDEPVHAENLASVLDRVSKQEAGTVLGVDACLGARSEVGSILVRPGPLKPGLGVNKQLPPVGDLHIAGVVNLGGFMEYVILQNTRLSLVMKMAQVISAGIVMTQALLEASGTAAMPGPADPRRRAIPGDLGSAGLPPPLPGGSDRRP